MLSENSRDVTQCWSWPYCPLLQSKNHIFSGHPWLCFSLFLLYLSLLMRTWKSLFWKKNKSLKSTLNFKVCPCNQTHQISGLISANNISLWVTFYLESEIPILAKIDLIRPYLSIGSRKNVQKSVFSWFKINNGTPKFLCCLVNHQEMSHNFVKLHFRDAPHPVSYEYMWWQKLYANRALLSPCHLIFNFLLKIASDSHQVQWVDSSKPRNDAKNLTLLNKSFNVIK